MDDADKAQMDQESVESIRKKLLIPRRPIKRVHDWCEDCGDRIESKRLAALPDASRCIGCQEAFEQFQRNYGG